jgi:hypothetical protein
VAVTVVIRHLNQQQVVLEVVVRIDRLPLVVQVLKIHILVKGLVPPAPPPPPGITQLLVFPPALPNPLPEYVF